MNLLTLLQSICPLRKNFKTNNTDHHKTLTVSNICACRTFINVAKKPDYIVLQGNRSLLWLNHLCCNKSPNDAINSKGQ